MFRRYTNIVFVIFRLGLSLGIFAVLLGGIYSAYKHFSGLDPLKLNPQTVFSNLLSLVNPIAPSPIQKEVFSFILVADSHSDNANLKNALTQAKPSNPEFIIGLGDYTEVGTVDELKKAKQEFDNLGLRYFLAVGDHDLWDCRNRSLPPDCNFKEVFGSSYQSFTYQDFRFIILYNSDNYLGFDDDQLKWLSDELEKAKNYQVKGIFVFLHEPLYHPSSDHVMGRIEKDLKNQARSLISTLKDGGVKKVFAGDTHYFSEYSEPETGLPMVTVGAISSERNPQTPRYGLVLVYGDGSTKVEDVEIK